MPSVQLFMPAILECAPVDEITRIPQSDDNHPAPVFLKFECGYVPTGVFCGLVTRIVTKEMGTKNKHVKRNKVSFLVGRLHLVTLISHDTCYEIRVERKGITTHLHELCSQTSLTVSTY